MKVSTLIITYNQEKYIGQAIESALMQKTTFAHEIVIGEDCSADRTRAIVSAFQARYPDQIRVFLRERNLGPNRNLVQTLKACRGQYVALLEGDDYWTSPDKLQQQVEYLTQHSDCAICFHTVECRYEDGSQQPQPYPGSGHKEITTLDDILVRNYIQTCSVVFRAGLIAEFPEWYLNAEVGDWPLHVMNARYGNIGFLAPVMGVHRISGDSVWSPLTDVQKALKIIETRRRIATLVGPKHLRMLANELSVDYHFLAVAYRESGQKSQALVAITRSFISSPLNAKVSKRHLLSLAVQILSPKSYAACRNARELLE
ncbi:MAG: glycosyltransferase family 2 protein [Limisphaerales bacterium]